MATPPLKIANLMAQAAQAKARQPDDQDADDAPVPGKKNPKQVAAAKEQEKAKGKMPPKTGKKPPMQGGM